MLNNKLSLKRFLIAALCALIAVSFMPVLSLQPVFADSGRYLYAVLDDNGTLTFGTSSDIVSNGQKGTITLAVDDNTVEPEEKTITGTVYKVDANGYSSADQVPWLSSKGLIKKVIADPAYDGDTEPRSTAHWFEGCSNLQSFTANNIFYSTRDMNSMFKDCSSLTTVDCGQCENVEDMSYMFAGCTSMTLGAFIYDYPELKTAAHMYEGCTSLIQADFYMSAPKLTDVSYMLNNCTSLRSLVIENSGNSASGCWPAVADLKYMCNGCTRLRNIGILEDANVGAPGADYTGMFKDCCFEIDLNLSGLNVDSSSKITDMFEGTATNNDSGEPWHGHARDVAQAKLFNRSETGIDSRLFVFNKYYALNEYACYDGKPAKNTSQRCIAIGTVIYDDDFFVEENPGYKFEGWYTDAALTKKAVFPFTMNSDVSVYAKWVKADAKKHNVSFNTNGGTSVSAQSVKDGEKATRPADPKKDGCVFKGWFTDSACTAAYDFSKPVKADITLYAKWEKKEIKISFNSGSGSAVNTQVVKAGEKVSKPEDPTLEGYTFAGWYTDKACTKAFDFATPVREDMTLYAKWTRKDAPAALLKLKVTASGKTSHKLTWSRVKGAKGYDVYFSRYGRGLSRIAHTKDLSYTKRHLKKGCTYRYRVKAYKYVNGKKVYISRSLICQSIAGNKGYGRTNAKSVTVSPSSVDLSVGQEADITAGTTKYFSGLKLPKTDYSPRYRWQSSDRNVATVEDGLITAEGSGTCTVYVYAQNGVRAAVSVTVE